MASQFPFESGVPPWRKPHIPYSASHQRRPRTQRRVRYSHGAPHSHACPTPALLHVATPCCTVARAWPTSFLWLRPVCGVRVPCAADASCLGCCPASRAPDVFDPAGSVFVSGGEGAPSPIAPSNLHWPSTQHNNCARTCTLHGSDGRPAHSAARRPTVSPRWPPCPLSHPPADRLTQPPLRPTCPPTDRN